MKIDYFLPNIRQKTDRRASTKLTQQLQNKFKAVSRVELGARLLQDRDKTNCQQDEASDSSILRPVTLASMSLSEIEKETVIGKEKH